MLLAQSLFYVLAVTVCAIFAASEPVLVLAATVGTIFAAILLSAANFGGLLRARG
jgi:hypothetical protein